TRCLSDWSSDVCSSDLVPPRRYGAVGLPLEGTRVSLEPLDDGSGLKQLIVSSATVMKRRIGLVEDRSVDALRAPGTVATGDVFRSEERRVGKEWRGRWA